MRLSRNRSEIAFDFCITQERQLRHTNKAE